MQQAVYKPLCLHLRDGLKPELGRIFSNRIFHHFGKKKVIQKQLNNLHAKKTANSERSRRSYLMNFFSDPLSKLSDPKGD